MENEKIARELVRMAKRVVSGMSKNYLAEVRELLSDALGSIREVPGHFEYLVDDLRREGSPNFRDASKALESIEDLQELAEKTVRLVSDLMRKAQDV